MRTFESTQYSHFSHDATQIDSQAGYETVHLPAIGYARTGEQAGEECIEFFFLFNRELEKNIIGMRLKARATGNLSTTNLKLDSQLRQQAEYQRPSTSGGNNSGSDSGNTPDPNPDGGGETPDPDPAA